MSDSGLRHYYSHLNSAALILELYDGQIPFAHFIKNYFSQNKKYGSKDRKQIAGLCYSYFRLGKAFLNIPVKERLLLALKHRTEPLSGQWQQVIEESALPETPLQNVFPWKEALSDGIDASAFEASFGVQPNLFLRIRPGYEKIVAQKLTASGLEFTINDHTVTLPNAAKIDDILLINKEVVIQDLNSQKMAATLELVKQNFPANHRFSIYDCCAASGGKSILAKDVLQHISLTVSDIRPSIITNLKKRFEQAGITDYIAFVTDLTAVKDIRFPQQYDVVIADVPCTGSGTWARTPEQLYFFDETKIDAYADLQQKICTNIINAVKPGGFLLYITCSVFKKENEEQVKSLEPYEFLITCESILEGYNINADTMYNALLFKKKKFS